MHLHRKTIHLLLGRSHQMLNHKGCWICLWRETESRCLSQLETKVLGATEQVLLHSQPRRPTGCHQAGDWKAALHGSWCSQIHSLQIRKYGSRSCSRIDGSPCSWAQIPNCAFLYIIWYSPTNQPINQPNTKTIKKICFYHKILCNYSFATERWDNPLI